MGISRRDFVKAGAGAFFVASSERLFGADAPSSRVRFAIAGCREGGRGQTVLDNALKVPGVDIVCVCDVDSRAMDFAAEAVRGRTGRAPRKERDFRKVLEMWDVDGVISVTPDHFHAYSAVMAMRAGKHVYVEKPCAYCPRECEVIRETWRETGMCFQMGSQRRSRPGYIQALREVREGNLVGETRYAKCWYNTRRGPIGRGKAAAVPGWLDWDLWQGPAPREAFRDNVVHYNWHWFRKWGTGECGNNSIHFVDVARWCLGAEWPERVVSSGGRYFQPTGQDWEWPDTQTVGMEFPGGKLITWEGTSCVNANPYMGVGTGCMVYGEKGTLYFMEGTEVRLYDGDGKFVREWGTMPKADRRDVIDFSNRAGGGPADSTAFHFANLVDCIRANAPERAASNADIGTKSTMLALLGNISLTTGEAIRVDPATGRMLNKGAAESLWSREYAKGWEI